MRLVLEQKVRGTNRNLWETANSSSRRLVFLINFKHPVIPKIKKHDCGVSYPRRAREFFTDSKNMKSNDPKFVVS